MARRLHVKDNHREVSLHNARLRVASVFMVLLLAVLLVRLVQLQVVRYDLYSTISDANRIQTLPVPPNRGLILDRTGTVLAENRPSFSLNIVREQVVDLEATLALLQQRLQLEDSELRRFRERLRRRQRPMESVPLRGNLSAEEMAIVAVDRHRLPGVLIESELQRYYPHADLLSHALGYVNRINEEDLELLDPVNYQGTHYVGRTGVERQYESVLHGRVGFRQVETNAFGQVMRVLDSTDPQPGSDIGLHLDLETQKAAWDAMAGRRGAVVALDPQTGGIIAFASTPGFDPNLFVNGISTGDYRYYADHPDRPLYNRAIQGQYPPGSTIKPAVALAALHYGVVDPHFTISDPGFFRLPGNAHQYRDWKKGGHGMVDLHKSVVVSCDTYYYTVSHRLGVQRLSSFLDGFGLGRPTGIDIPNELGGILPNEAWKQKVLRQPWFPGETLIMGIGQGYMLMTPLQLALEAAVLANRGLMVTPTFLRSIDGSELRVPARRRTVVVNNPEWWAQVNSAMEDVVHSTSGTAHWSVGRDISYHMAAKTGTAQVKGIKQGEVYREHEVPERLRDHALFVAYAPSEAPRIAVGVIVENGAHGSTTAAPIARKVIDTWLFKQPDFVPVKPEVRRP